MKPVILKRIAIPLFLVIGIPLLMSYFLRGTDKVGNLITAVVFIFVIGLPLFAGYFALKKPKFLICLNLLTLLLISIISAAFAYKPDVLTQLISMLLLFYLFILMITNLLSVAKFWEEYGFRSLIPFGISVLCVISIIFTNNLGHRIRLKMFEKRLPQYEEVIQLVKSRIKNEPISLEGKEIPKQYKHLAYWINAEKDEKGVLIVTFFWGNGFPVKHSAFQYRSDGIDGPLPGWPHVVRINKHWFKVGD